MKKKVSLWLAVCMMLSVFTVMPMAASAAEKLSKVASWDEMIEAERRFNGGSRTIKYEVIDGAVWMNGTGNATPVQLTDFYHSADPTKPRVKQIWSGMDNISILTEEGRIFSLVTSGGQTTGARDFFPNLENLFDGGTPLELVSRLIVKVQMPDQSIKFYFMGGADFGQCSATPATVTAGTSITKPTPVSAEFEALLDGKIVDIEYAHYVGNTMIFLTDKGSIYTLGGNSAGNIGNGTDNAVYGTPYCVTANAPLTGKKFTQILEASENIVALQDNGDLWTWGRNCAGIFGNGVTTSSWNNPAGRVLIPYHTYTKQDVHRITGISNSGIWFVTKDNVFMKQNRDGANAVFSEDISNSETILAALAPEHGNTVVLMKSGNKYCSSNTDVAGIAGTGTVGKPLDVNKPVPESPEIPVTVPISKNQISMEIETTDPDGTQHRISSWSLDVGLDLTNVKIRAGQRMRVNIYMEDFAKINTFHLPLHFNPDYLQVVNSDGRAYDPARVYPGFNGKSGLTTRIPTQVYDPNAVSTIWDGGILENNAYSPVVDNGVGVVTVIGTATTDKFLNAKIEGKQLMYSVEFIGVSRTLGSDKVEFGLGEEGNDADPAWQHAAQWFALRETDSATGNGFLFENPDFVSFTMYEVELTDITLGLYRDEIYEVSDRSDVAGESNYFALDRRNYESKYKVVAGFDPVDASFPHIEQWTCEFAKSNGTGATVSDYITVTDSENPGYFEFKINEGIFSSDVVNNEAGVFQPGYLKFVAKNTRVPHKDGVPDGTREIYVKIVDNIPAPTALTIANKGTNPGEFGDPNGIGGVFKANAASQNAFADMTPPLEVADTFTFVASMAGDEEKGYSKDVKWELLQVTERNLDGSIAKTSALGTDAGAPAVISATNNTDASRPTCTVKAQTSMEETADVVLKLSSSVDPAMCDYVPVKVQLAPYAVNFPTKSVILVNGDSVKQTYDLTKQMVVSPVDAMGYEIEYVEAVAPTGRDNPNVQVKTVEKDGEVQGIVEPIRSDAEYQAGKYDTVTVHVKTTINGQELKLTQTQKFYTIDAVAPENMYVRCVNNAGTANDYIKFTVENQKSQLQAGDILTVYPDFTTNTPLSGWDNKTLTQADVEELLSGGIKVTSGLNDAGGTIGYQLTRLNDKAYAKTPVVYDPAAIKVSGYIKLDGKLANSQYNNGITVTLEGVKGSDGKPVRVATAANGSRNGFFEFEQYLPAGQHKLTISHQNYLTRNVTFTMKETADFEVSTYETPILLYPGDLDGKRGVQYDDVNEFRINYMGKYFDKSSGNRTAFEKFNFVEEIEVTPAINVFDINIILKRITMQTADYQPWTVE